jgi:hypothetical protein
MYYMRSKSQRQTKKQQDKSQIHYGGLHRMIVKIYNYHIGKYVILETKMNLQQLRDEFDIS